MGAGDGETFFHQLTDTTPDAAGERSDVPLPAKVELHPRKVDQRSAVRQQQETRRSGDDVGGEGEGGGDWTGEGRPNSGDGGSAPGGGTGGSGDGSKNVEGPSDGDGKVPASRRTPLQIERQRCFCVDPSEGRYELVFTSPSKAKAFLRLRSIGESEVLDIGALSARALDEGRTLEVDSTGEIGPIELLPDEKYRLEVLLPDHIRCALEIMANEDNV